MKTVMAMGTFDVLHPGHLDYLQQAKRYGNYLIVVVARDATVKKEKGRKPVVNEKDRLRLVQQLRVVDKAVLGNVGDKLKVVEQMKPEIICLGYDQRVNEKQLRAELHRRGLTGIITRRMQPYKKRSYKSAILKQKGFFD